MDPLSPLTLERLRDVSRNIRRLANARGIPLAHLADRAGIGRTTIWRILDVNEKGPSDPRVGTLTVIASALGVDIIDLFEREEPAR